MCACTSSLEPEVSGAFYKQKITNWQQISRSCRIDSEDGQSWNGSCCFAAPAGRRFWAFGKKFARLRTKKIFGPAL
jgi:hypothetical protein